MKNKKIKVNRKTFEWLKEQIPTDKNPFSLMSYAMNVYNSITIEVDDELGDNVIKIEEEE